MFFIGNKNHRPSNTSVPLRMENLQTIKMKRPQNEIGENTIGESIKKVSVEHLLFFHLLST